MLKDFPDLEVVEAEAATEVLLLIVMIMEDMIDSEVAEEVVFKEMTTE